MSHFLHTCLGCTQALQKILECEICEIKRKIIPEKNTDLVEKWLIRQLQSTGRISLLELELVDHQTRVVDDAVYVMEEKIKQPCPEKWHMMYLQRQHHVAETMSVIRV
jgi:hypothetical protein